MCNRLKRQLFLSCMLTFAMMACMGCIDEDKGTSSSSVGSEETVRDLTQSRNAIYEQNPSDLAFSSDEAGQLVCEADPETNTPACPLPPK